MKTISKVGLKLIQSFEGCSLIAYDDLQPNTILLPSSKIKGTLTIGWGHTGNVKIGQTISKEDADILLEEDLKRYEKYVNDSTYVPLTKQLNQNQFDALVSFCYNCGQGNLKTLCTNRTFEQISLKILEYTKSKGIVLKGLVRRREAERTLFNTIQSVTNIDDPDYLIRIIKLEKLVMDTVEELTRVSSQLKEVAAPKWFTKEFPNADKLINQKIGTLDFWRSFAIALRIIENKS